MSSDHSESHRFADASRQNELFDLLANRRRRCVIHALRTTEEAVDLGTVSELVAARENGGVVADVSHEERKSVYTSLQQHHLPKMDDWGVIQFDKERGIVAPTEAFTDARIHLEVLQGREFPWSLFYVGYGIVGVAIALALGVSAPLIAALPAPVWIGLYGVGLSLAAGYHYAKTSRLRLEPVDRPPKT